MRTRPIAAFIACSAALALTGCGRQAESATTQQTPPRSAAKATAPVGSLQWAIEGPWRLEPERDKYQHPAETLTFFGLQPNMAVVEALPGRGWYTSILAPYLAKGGGRLYAAGWDRRHATDDQLATLAEFDARFKPPRDFGAIERVSLSPKTTEIVPAGTADLVLAINVTHAFMAEGYAEQAFRAFYAALKPGGVLGVEQHRARSSGLQDPQAGAGYVQEEYVKLLAKEAGFEFVGSSEINANPRDTKDYPFGVWTLLPVLRTAPLGLPDDSHFDMSKYVAIGESDRMTLKFRKPEADGLRGAQAADKKPS